MEELHMDKKRALVNYLLGVMQHLEQERGRRMSYTDFAKLVDLPNKTAAAMFDPDDPRLPSKANATKVAVGLGNNEINRILGYPDVDPNYISFMRTYRQLNTEQQSAILREMRTLAEPQKNQAFAA
jgi:hypothetical protein